MSWIEKLTDLNLLAVRDVALDLQDAAQLSDHPRIPIIPTRVRFMDLMPIDGAQARDRYGTIRGQALQLLEKRGVVRAVKSLHDPYDHRWQGQMTCDVVDQAQFGAVLAELKNEHQRRIDKQAAKQQNLPASPPDPLLRLRNLLKRFHAVALTLRNRRTGRKPLEIADEYDVQYLLGALLKVHFDDVRPEEWTPSYAGRSARTDFLLKEEQLVVEVKMTRAGLTDGDVGEQLILDIAHYEKHPDCKTLACFVYDPDHRLTNPGGLEADLSRKRPEMTVEVVITPSR